MNFIHITCPKCKKTFEAKKEEITNNGREVQCGSCKFVWFFNYSKIQTSGREKPDIFNKYPGEIPRDVEILISDAEKAK